MAEIIVVLVVMLYFYINALIIKAFGLFGLCFVMILNAFLPIIFICALSPVPINIF